MLQVFACLLLALLLFVFWFSPRLGGLLTWGKPAVDPTVFTLEFDTTGAPRFYLDYPDLSGSQRSRDLRSSYPLDSLVANSSSDFEKVRQIQSWVQRRWKHDGNNVAEKQDARYILQEAEKGKQFRCVEYSLVTSQCLAALGFRVRTLGLMARDIDEVESGGGHVVNEVYLPDLRKWVFLDPQYDVITTRNGVPLHAVELQEIIARGDDFELVNPNMTVTPDEYRKWIGPYLYYFYVTIPGESISLWDRIAGNKKQLTLYPKQARQPRYFQGMMRINTAYYTHAVRDFYPVLHLAD